jgi:hypothetical protein
VLFRTLACTIACWLALASAAQADQWFSVDGRDSFHFGGDTASGEIVYSGTQRLTEVRTSGGERFTATVDYKRNANGTTDHLHGTFTSLIAPDGTQSDEDDEDPDYLTILNQPFAIALDPRTLHDLRALHGPVPFDFAAPMTGAPLHGQLRRLPDAKLDGASVLGIEFSAQGPLHGALPDRPTLSVTGTIHMNGTAYYRESSAHLLTLITTISIVGTLDSGEHNETVDIAYRRTIHPLRAVPHPHPS